LLKLLYPVYIFSKQLTIARNEHQMVYSNQDFSQPAMSPANWRVFSSAGIVMKTSCSVGYPPVFASARRLIFASTRSTPSRASQHEQHPGKDGHATPDRPQRATVQPAGESHVRDE
jgi:hypothetical protein